MLPPVATLEIRRKRVNHSSNQSTSVSVNTTIRQFIRASVKLNWIRNVAVGSAVRTKIPAGRNPIGVSAFNQDKALRRMNPDYTSF